MPSWNEIAEAEPELAAAALRLLDAHVHKTIATLRRDGSPRISGIEAKLIDGDLWFGSMPNAVKAKDLRRDPRFALHSGSDDPPAWSGDAKLAGRAVEITDEAERRRVFDAMGATEVGTDSHLFRADVEELTVTRLNDERDKLIVESWHPGRGVERIER